MNNILLLNLGTTINGMTLSQGSDTNFKCTINTPGCATVNGLKNEGGAKMQFSGNANS